MEVSDHAFWNGKGIVTWEQVVIALESTTA